MLYHRQSNRLNGYDYTQAGAYFVTLVTEGRIGRFGAIQNGEMRLNALGQITLREWQALPGRFPGLVMDAFVIMPNHLHGLLFLNGSNPTQTGPGAFRVAAGSLGAMMRAFKASTTLRFHQLREGGPSSLWQRNYYDHILREPSELDDIRTYILTNPVQWELDRENPNRVV